MFTGIIQNLGVIVGWDHTADGGRLFIKPQQSFDKIMMGESIAINGCCLTVVSEDAGVLAFDVSDETMRKTAFQSYGTDMIVNLERAMQASDRFGGHFVLGHVDAVGSIKNIQQNTGSVAVTIGFPEEFRPLLIEKGSVTIDGISLTACDVTSNTLSLYIIPHTLHETNLAHRKINDVVNLEFDVLGKYVLNSVVKDK